MNLRNRLKRLEKLQPKGPTLWLVYVDEAGLILDDGSAEVKPWVGRHYSELPSVGKILTGLDPAWL
ncbi:MAG TPA: hypothetical protein VEL76_26860 [Gemmataceae bacterium]|nr:hypothetical protein [Gemmataceae bacterium]